MGQNNIMQREKMDQNNIIHFRQANANYTGNTRRSNAAIVKNHAESHGVSGAFIWMACSIISMIITLVITCCKVEGTVAWGWPAVFLSYFWIPVAAMAGFLALEEASHAIHMMVKKIKRN